ncbi:MAG: hypothetical protein JWN61_327, partial [Pseudonocardiales bacterium]|nr:hypothetical protein [Pseudonocardiales bacterium]
EVRAGEQIAPEALRRLNRPKRRAIECPPHGADAGVIGIPDLLHRVGHGQARHDGIMAGPNRSDYRADEACRGKCSGSVVDQHHVDLGPKNGQAARDRRLPGRSADNHRQGEGPDHRDSPEHARGFLDETLGHGNYEAIDRAGLDQRAGRVGVQRLAPELDKGLGARGAQSRARAGRNNNGGNGH